MPKKLSASRTQIRRAHHGDFRIAADDDGVGVVPRVAPAPGHRVAHNHEAGKLVDGVVHPLRLERRAVAAFVPARVRRGTVEHPIDEEEGDAPPGAPEIDAPGGAGDKRGEPHCRIADRRAVLAPHQLLHPLPRNVGVIPVGRREPAGDGGFRIPSDQAVVARPALGARCTQAIRHSFPPEVRSRQLHFGANFLIGEVFQMGERVCSGSVSILIDPRRSCFEEDAGLGRQ